MVSNQVPADQVEAFLAWHTTMSEAESRYPGFRGSEVFRPVEGVQNEWTTIYRFDTAEHLDNWLTSDERRKLLAENRFGTFTMRKIDQSFGNWFTFDGTAATPPSDFKTSVAVWFGLYPTVMPLSLLGAPRTCRSGWNAAGQPGVQLRDELPDHAPLRQTDPALVAQPVPVRSPAGHQHQGVRPDRGDQRGVGRLFYYLTVKVGVEP